MAVQATWIKIRTNPGEYCLSTMVWTPYLTPECAAAWPSGHRMGAVAAAASGINVQYIPSIFYSALANAYAAVDPGWVGRARSQSHIGALPGDLRVLIRKHLLKYVFYNIGSRNVYSLEFCRIAVGVGEMPLRVITYHRGGREVCEVPWDSITRKYSEQLELAVKVMPPRNTMCGVCGVLAKSANAAACGPCQLVGLCKSPPRY